MKHRQPRKKKKAQRKWIKNFVVAKFNTDPIDVSSKTVRCEN